MKKIKETELEIKGKEKAKIIFKKIKITLQLNQVKLIQIIIQFVQKMILK